MKQQALLISALLFILLIIQKTEKRKDYFPTNIPHSENCQHPYKEIVLVRPEYGIPISKKVICKYGDDGILSEVHIYNYEKGFQEKKPVRSVKYEWRGRVLRKIFISNHLSLVDRPYKEIINLN